VLQDYRAKLQSEITFSVDAAMYHNNGFEMQAADRSTPPVQMLLCFRAKKKK